MPGAADQFHRTHIDFWGPGKMPMTEAVELSLEHGEKLRERLESIQARVSEFDFTNVYLFRHAHDYRIVEDGEMFVRGRSYDDREFLMPTVDLREMDPDHVAEIAAQVDFIYPVPEEWLEELDDERFEITAEDAERDYIYTTEKMARYPGRNLHNKRNQLRQFERIYCHTSHCFTEDDIDDALSILEEWQGKMHVPPEETDYRACREALEKFGSLNLCGVICYIKGEPSGFILGDGLTDDTYAIHFAKGKRQVKGIYEFLYSRVANHVWEDYDYLNLEQDLGISALRQAKSSYEPDMWLKKYRVAVK